jgi:hypothetical protein
MVPRKHFLLVGGGFAAITFGAFYLGVAIILNNEVLTENLLAFGLFALLIGTISSIFVYLERKIGFYIFAASYVIGFSLMLYTFSTGMAGWEGLIGLIQMMMIVGAGLAIAVFVEIVIFFVNRSKNKQI